MPPRARTQHPTPTRCPEAPAQSDTAHAALPASRHPSSRPAPRDPGLAAASGPGQLTVSGAHSARSSAPGPHPRLASAPLPAPGPVPAPQVSAPRWKQQQRAGRACVRARARVRVRGRATALPCAPAPAFCPPRCDASRIPNARSHPPALTHKRASVQSAAAPPAPHFRLSLLGRSQRAGCTGPAKLAECGPRRRMSKPASPSELAPPQVPNCLQRGAPRASLLRHHAPPGRGRSPSLNPYRGAQLGLPTLTLRGTSSLFAYATTRSRVLSRSLFPRLLSLSLFTSSLFSYLLPDPNLLSLAFSLATVLPPSPALPAPHLPELPLTFSA